MWDLVANVIATHTALAQLPSETKLCPRGSQGCCLEPEQEAFCEGKYSREMQIEWR